VLWGDRARQRCQQTGCLRDDTTVRKLDRQRSCLQNCEGGLDFRIFGDFSTAKHCRWRGRAMLRLQQQQARIKRNTDDVAQGRVVPLLDKTSRATFPQLFPLPRALPVIASAAKQSISPRDGPPPSSQNQSCSNCFKDQRRQRTTRGQIGGRAAAEPWIASLRSQ